MTNFLTIFLGILFLSLCVMIDSITADPDSHLNHNKNSGHPIARAKQNEKIYKRIKRTKEEERRENGPRSAKFLNTRVAATTECYTNTGERGTCVLYYQCDPDSRANAYIVSSGSYSSKSKCQHYLEVCCRDEDQENMETIPQCGWSNPGAGASFTSGTRSGAENQYAEFGEYPWMVAVLRKTDNSGYWNDNDFLGGGTLIHPSVVLTVAHRLTIPGSGGRSQYVAKDLKCRAGEWDTRGANELYVHQERDVDSYIVHKNFDPVSMINDIALLIMTVPFDLGSHIAAACLPTGLPPVGYSCYSAGWGRDTITNKVVLSPVMKKAKLFFYDQDRCTKLLLRTSRTSSLIFHHSISCLNNNERLDACREDGGSPLMCPVSSKQGERRFAVYGMAVNRVDCSNPHSSVLAADLPVLKRWVDQKMQDSGFDTRYYTM